MPSTAGSYVLKFFANGGWTILATSPTITVQGSAPATITVTPTTVTGGGTVSVTVANGPGNATDWVALIPAGAADSAFVDWQYLNGTKTQPTTGVTSAALTFSMPSTAGSYVLKFFASGGWTILATSPTITVQGSAPTP